jgi:hypothetical protein
VISFLSGLLKQNFFIVNHGLNKDECIKYSINQLANDSECQELLQPIGKTEPLMMKIRSVQNASKEEKKILKNCI